MNLALKCKFDIQFCSTREYDSGSGDNMTRQDFVRQMNETLDEQKRNTELDQREKLHDAEVMTKQGLKNWDALHREVETLTNQIGIRFLPLEGHAFRIKNDSNELDVHFEGDISYTGVAQGLFQPAVKGSDLVYSLQEKSAPIGHVTALLERIGQTFTIEEVAEHLVRIVVGG